MLQNISVREKIADRPHRITIVLALLAAAITVVGILWNHNPRNRPLEVAKQPAPPAASMHIDKIEQKANTAVAGVQGNVIVNSSNPKQTAAQPKQ